MADDVASLNVEGMSCQHCVNRIENNVGNLNGVVNVKVSLTDKKVFVEFDNDKVSVDIIKSVIEDQGYTVK